MSESSRKRKTKKELIDERRQLRRDLGERGSLMNLPEEAGKVFRWVNNQEVSGINRINRLESIGWQVWQGENAEVDEATGLKNIQLGTGGRLVVGANEKFEPMEAVIMWIDKDLYDMDQALKAEQVDLSEQEIVDRPGSDGLYGNVQIGTS